MKLLLATSSFCACALLLKGQPPAVTPLSNFEQKAVRTETIEKTLADYSEEARIAELEGTVSISATIGEDGHPRDLHLIEKLGLGLDEPALEAAREQSFDASAAGISANFEVRYHLPSKNSRWHLIHAEFQPPAGASRPRFRSTGYPTGAGILSGAAVEEGRVIGAAGREGTARVSFTIDERGVPVHFEILSASEEIWGREAIAVLTGWRFEPAVHSDKPIPVAATFELAWGPRELNPNRIAGLRAALESPPVASNAPVLPAKPGVPAIEILRQVQPEYSQEALDAKLEGGVTVSLVTQADGTPGNLHVIQGLGKGLDEKALDALSQWRFKPIFVNGSFYPSELTLRVYFTLKK